MLGCSEQLAVGPARHLRAEHRVVLGERRVPLLLEVGLRAPRDGVEEDRLLDRRHERVTDPAQHRVVRPDRQLVLARRLERPRVVQQMALRVLGIEPEAAGHDLVDAPAARLDVVGGDERVRLWMLALGIDEPDRVEDLHRLVGVERGDDLRDRVEVAVDELAEAPVVVHGARSRSGRRRTARRPGCRTCSGRRPRRGRSERRPRPPAGSRAPAPIPRRREPAPRTARARSRPRSPGRNERAPAARAPSLVRSPGSPAG